MNTCDVTVTFLIEITLTISAEYIPHLVCELTNKHGFRIKVFMRNDAVLTSCFVRFNFSEVVLFDDSVRRECDAMSLG
jgi:hypothetical protein